MEEQICRLEFHGSEFKNVKVSPHGVSTLNNERHSYNVNFPQDKSILINNIEMDFFYLISLEEDVGYCNNLLGYTILSDSVYLFPISL